MGRGRLLDVKEWNFVKYVTKNIIAPISFVVLALLRLRPQFEKKSDLVITLAQIGSLATLYAAFVVIRFLYRKATRPAKDVRSYGKWAIVTGATSGIGEAFCHELASRGMDILLISRSESKLTAVSRRIEETTESRTDHMVHDFASTAKSDFESRLASKLSELSSDGGVGMLVNCVGVANEIPALTHETPPEEIRQMLQINVQGTTVMILAALPQMMKRKSGAIITVSSGSCTHPMPMLSLYSATKAFGSQLTRSMYYEFKEHGIDCLAITPYYFVSNMFKRKKATMIAPFPKTIVNNTLPLLGYQAESYGYWAHQLGGMVSRLTPKDPGDRLLVGMKQSRERAMRKNK